jgi:hypothetical protein
LDAYIEHFVIPSPLETKQAEERVRILQSYLSGFPIERTFIIGSYSRGTSIHPLHDIDLMAIINPTALQTEDYNSMTSIILQQLFVGCQSVIETKEFYYLLTRKNGDKMTVRRQNCSIGICWGDTWTSKEVTFDIVPAIESDNGSFKIFHRKLSMVRVSHEGIVLEILWHYCSRRS